MKKFISSIIILFCTGLLFAQPSPFDPPVVKAFADTLYQQGFLSQAQGEYKRYLFSVGNLTELDELGQQEYQDCLLSMCNIYKVQNDKAGITWLKDSFFDVSQPLVKEKINHVQGSFIFRERNADTFSLFASSPAVAGQSSLFTPEFMNLVTASELVLKKDITQLSDFCSEISTQYTDFQKLGQLASDYKTKSPGLALFLSFMVPGCGKWYTGSFGAFVSSFLTIGSFAAGTIYTGIQTSWKSWQPYVFGACGLVLYIADMYGAYQSAKRYNDALFRILCEETERLYDVTY